MFPSENTRPSSRKTDLLKPCCLTTSIDGMLPRQNRSECSPPDLKALSSSVSFNGWRRPNRKFKSWARKMSYFHKPTWIKSGIFEAVMASTKVINKNTDLLLGIAEKWCPETKTFVFSWGEATITLEDVMVLLGFSVLGSPYFATLDSSGEKIKEKLEKEWLKIKSRKSTNYVAQKTWMDRFMDSGDDLEHVAFLVVWLSYFVFPSCYFHIDKAILPIAVHISSGTRVALAPAVLAHLYAELTLLKTHIRHFTITSVTDDKMELTSLFKLVQVWTWERFRELRLKKLNPLLKGESRLALWYDQKQNRKSNVSEMQRSSVRKILEKSSLDSFEWRPYTKDLENWKFPLFYPEKAMRVPVDPNLDDEFISFARCIKVAELVGIDCVEHYFPNRVASQFGLLQDIPCPVNRNNISREAAWDEYNKPIDDLTLYIPSRSATPRFTPMFCKWWRELSPELQYSPNESQVVESLTPRNIIGDEDTSNYVPSGSKRSKRVCEDDESNTGHCQTQVTSDNDEEDDSLTIAQLMRLKKKYNDVESNGIEASEQLGKISRLEGDSNDSGFCQKLASIRADGDETGRKAGMNTVLSPSDVNYSSDSSRVLPLSGLLQKLGEGFPEKLKRSRYLRTTRNVISEIKKGEIVNCGGSVSREMPLGELFQKDLVKKKGEHLGNKRVREDDDESCMDCYDSNTIAELMRSREKTGGDASESLGRKSSLDADNNDILQKLASDKTAAEPREIEKRSEEEETGREANLGANVVVDIVVSPPETRQNCDDKVDVSGVNAEKRKTMVGDGTKKAEGLLHEGGEKQRSDDDEKEDDDDERLKQRNLRRIDEVALNLEARMMKVEKTLTEIREWKTRRN